jgi:ubiquinone/menaquinone biosynthesis C-methylase UbiE
MFFQTYTRPHHTSCLDVGSYDVNGTLRSLSPAHVKYVGMDLEAGPGVDLVLQDPHKFPFEDNQFDLIVSSSCFEHDNMFWVTFLECVRVLKPGGFLYVNAPSNGCYHAYPQDNWRFYPDSGKALEAWAHKNAIQAFLVESFLTKQRAEGQFNDCAMVFSKGEKAAAYVPTFISGAHHDAYNIRIMTSPNMIKFQEHTEDHEQLWWLHQEVNKLKSQVHAVQSPPVSLAPSVDARPAPAAAMNKFACTVCGNHTYYAYDVLWPDLIAQWQLNAFQAQYVNQQQGVHCAKCHNNLRSQALAKAICDGSTQRLPEWIQSHAHEKVLEINTAGTLHGMLAQMPHHVLAEYPDVDMQHMSYVDAQFDLIVHSDTLEHVPDPAQALRECHRVLKPGGRLCFTVPVIVERLTRSRQGLPNSFHGSSGTQDPGLMVHTEFGADVWRSCVEAGFEKVSQHVTCYPAGIAITAYK